MLANPRTAARRARSYRADSGLTRLWTVEGAALVTSEYAISEAERNLAEPERRARLEKLLEDVERRALDEVVSGTSERGGVA